MRRVALLGAVAAAMMLAGCGHRADTTGDDTALTAPVANQAEIANFVPPAAPGPTPTPRSLPPGAQSPSETADGSAQAARTVAMRYFDDIAAGRYGDAWGLWSNHGKASNLSPDAFAARFHQYRRYRAVVGVPRDPGGGAGQRFIEVPVRVDAVDRNGRPASQAGTLTLHRVTSVVETGDPSRHLWRINAAAIRPVEASFRTAAVTGMPASASARYVCGDGFDFMAKFDNVVDRATLTRHGRQLAVLAGQRPASGLWYAGEGWELRGKGREATLARPGTAATHCRVSDT